MAQVPSFDPTDPRAREDRLRVAERLPENGVIERVEERAVIGKRIVDEGGIRVSTRTETVQDTVRDTLEDVAVEVERVPVGRFVEAAEAPRSDGDVTILPVYEERLVVEKRLFLVEEVHVRRKARSREVEVPVELHRQVAEVERLPPLGEHASPDTHSGVTRMMDDTYTGTRTVTAMFDTAAEAERAASRLRSAGIPDSQIRVTQGSNTSYSGTVDTSDTTYRDQHKGFWDSLADFFFPEEDRYAYAEGLARGSHMVTVSGFESTMYDAVVDILDDEGSVDLDARESEWRSSGWSDYRTSPYYANPNDISGTGGMAGGTSGLSGAAAGLGHTIGSAAERTGDAIARGADRVGDALTGDSNTRGTIYDDGMQDRNLQMAADTGRRSQADLGSQQQGYADTASMRQTTGLGATDYRDEDYNEDGTLKVVEERLNVGKREVEGGAVRVRSYVREEPVSADVDLRAQRVYVERRPVDRAVNPGDVQFGDRTLEAREYREEPVVNKEARVVEEIGLRKETEVERQTIQDTVRKTEVEIEDERTGDRTRLTGDRTRDDI
ncbi:hypothetical protein Rumeso_00162 [Rubellimicrobium mesophilum DSM 19309]|uniref:DUF2382 domain-containing protein n=1 Tax=Rubellimicrobium mesophilum DSM 19309 TaxID=442562 RepID=A0A017HVY4_9RHOB|nr:YsnF/AvaK domain-containing protein [Rubellimicrobium mesophilum]EYD78333.1 hypothetical protein Rumeso_00162 [Rubellimicrobium mesophilum DSM 19309]